MIDVYEEYRKKLVTPQEAVKLVKDGDWVDYSQTCSFPEALDETILSCLVSHQQFPLLFPL